MVNNSEHCRSHCPINFLLEALGDKWTLLIVRDLMFKGKKRFGEFLQSDEKIATNILATRLKQLEENHIIIKSSDPESGSKRLYQLTDKGKDLLPIMLEITDWSAKHDALTNTPPDFAERLKTDKAAIAADILAALE